MLILTVCNVGSERSIYRHVYTIIHDIQNMRSGVDPKIAVDMMLTESSWAPMPIGWDILSNHWLINQDIFLLNTLTRGRFRMIKKMRPDSSFDKLKSIMILLFLLKKNVIIFFLYIVIEVVLTSSRGREIQNVYVCPQ